MSTPADCILWKVAADRSSSYYYRVLLKCILIHIDEIENGYFGVYISVYGDCEVKLK